MEEAPRPLKAEETVACSGLLAVFFVLLLSWGWATVAVFLRIPSFLCFLIR
jgi:hypothetical protein